MIKYYSDNLNRLLNEIKNEDAEITKKDIYLQSLVFENDLLFYEWSSNDFPFEIAKLLNGNKTVFYADVRKTQFDALKFCTINIQIKIKYNSTVSQNLNSLLNEKVLIELTHSGISNYKLKNDIYVTNLNYKSDKKLLLLCQYGSKSINNANEAYRKLSSNKPILSPYTLWEIQLKPIIKNHVNIFNEISSIIKDQNEIMHGIGKYLKDEYDGKSICKNKRDSNKKVMNKCSNRDNYSIVRKVF